ncbi:hypothetical protein [Acinetobacter junii]|uniref:hypothetical protein n=1 Tax=Acinetobacter junii TaxID=40215 RepID=UPI00124F9BF8|nr:hypothetical protein [Acinetobacter junii]
MSYLSDYSISLFTDKNRENLHKKFKISTHNDQIRGEIKYAYSKIIEKDNINLNLIKFVTEDLSIRKYTDLIREIFYRKDYKDIQITKISDLLEKGKINNNDPDFKFTYPEQFKIYNHIKIESEQNLTLLGEQLDILILELKKDWIESNFSFEEDINEKLSLDFEQENNLDYGYCESELVLFDILAFIKYAISYINNNPNAEMYYTQETYEEFDYSSEAYEIVEKQFS